MEPIDISLFRYKSKYQDPGRSYSGNAAIHFITSDIIALIFRNKTKEISYESRYLSHVIDLFIDGDHLKRDKWFDNIDELKGKNARLNATAVAIVVKNLGPYLKSLFTNRNKQYNAVMAEKFASDFED